MPGLFIDPCVITRHGEVVDMDFVVESATNIDRRAADRHFLQHSRFEFQNQHCHIAISVHAWRTTGGFSASSGAAQQGSLACYTAPTCAVRRASGSAAGLLGLASVAMPSQHIQ